MMVSSEKNSCETQLKKQRDFEIERKGKKK